VPGTKVALAFERLAKAFITMSAFMVMKRGFGGSNHASPAPNSGLSVLAQERVDKARKCGQLDACF